MLVFVQQYNYVPLILPRDQTPRKANTSFWYCVFSFKTTASSWYYHKPLTFSWVSRTICSS